MLILYVAIFALITVAVIYVFLIMPRWSDSADMDLQSTDYALDGLFEGNIPRSSYTAFAEAKAYGYGIALTAQMTSDGQLVAFPCSDLRRACGFSGRICDTDSALLSSLRIGKSAHSIPTLASVLELVDGQVPLLIEIRPSKNLESLCRHLCEMLDGYGGAFAIRSTDPWVLGFFKKYRPRFARGQTICASYPKGTSAFRIFAMKHMLTNVISRPDFFVVDQRFIREPAFIIATKLFHAKGFVRGVKNSKQYLYCRRYSLYTIFENIRPK